MSKGSGLLAVAIAGLGACAWAPGFDWQAAEPGVEQFGRLVGHWRIDQEILQPDGSFAPQPPATWSFFYALGGHAVRDVWIQPGRHTAIADEETRQYGTNLRVYVPEDDQWRVTWVSSDDRVFAVYTAMQLSDGRMRMTGTDPSRPGVKQRITYYDFQPDSWRWSLEFSRNGSDWLTVSRMTAERMR